MLLPRTSSVDEEAGGGSPGGITTAFGLVLPRYLPLVTWAFMMTVLIFVGSSARVPCLLFLCGYMVRL